MDKKAKKYNYALQFQIKDIESLTSNNEKETNACNRSKNSNSISFLGNYNIAISGHDSSLLSRNEEKFANDSMWIFSSTNKFRVLIQKIISYKIFHKFILICILLNCICLIFETIPKLRPINTYSNHIFIVIFTLECIMKIIAYGFILDDNTYLRDPWNILDFVVVVTALISYFPSINAQLLALRIFRLLRPLKAMSTLPRMRIFISSLLNSLIDLTNVLLMLLFFIILFGILGLSLWGERFNFRCRTVAEPSENGVFEIMAGYEEKLCGGEVKCEFCKGAYDFYPKTLNKTFIKEEQNYEAFNYGLTNFDNIINSIFVVFVATTGEGWVKIMKLMMDGYNYYVSFIFFVLCVVINYFFMLNLTVAVLIYNLEITREHELALIDETVHDKNALSKNTKAKNRKIKQELKYVNIKMHNVKLESEKKKYRRKYVPIKSVQRKEEIKALSSMVHRIKKIACIEYVKRESYYHIHFLPGYICYFIYKQPIVQYFFYFCIIINAIFLMMERVNMSSAESSVMETANFVLVCIFAFEIIIAIFALGVKFFKDLLNIWDFLVVAFSIIEIILKEVNQTNVTSSSANVANVFRTLRILRIFKLFPQWTNFHIILESIWLTCVRMIDYTLLFILFIFMYSMLGYSLFNESSPPIDFTFKNFGDCLLTVFYVIIGDHWTDIYFAFYNEGHANKVGCTIYFVTLVLLGHIAMMNIFLAYLIENFENAKRKLEKNVIVRNFILNVMYYCSKAHELQLKTEKKKFKDKSMVTMLNKVLQRMFNKKLLSEGVFKISNKAKIDFFHMKKNKEDDVDDVNIANGNIKLQYFFENEKEKNDQQSDYFPFESDDAFYEFEIDYYDDNIINANANEDDLELNEDVAKQRAKSCYKSKKRKRTSKELFRVARLESIVEKNENEGSPDKNDLSLFSGTRLLETRKKSSVAFNNINDDQAENLFRRERNSQSQEIKEKVSQLKMRTKTVFIPHGKGIDFLTSPKNNVPSIKKKIVTISTTKQNKCFPYNRSECWEYMKNSSLFLFHIQSPFRVFMRRLTKHKIFNYVIMILIIGNIIVLALDSEWVNPNSIEADIIKWFNFAFNIIFIVEGICKIISDDFIFHSKYQAKSFNKVSTLTSFKSLNIDSFNESQTLNLSNVLTTNPNIDSNNEEKEQYIAAMITAINSQKAYLLDPVNFLDFICIIIGIIDIASSGTGQKIRYLRTLRVFRSIKPIRLFTKSENLSLIINCLTSSLPAILNVMIVCGMFIIIFALLGVNVFKNDLRNVCTNETITDKENCILNGYHWVYNYENFGNFALSLKANFEIMMAEDWGRIMMVAKKKMNTAWVYVYYIIYVIIAHLFIRNLLVSVVVRRFKELKKHEKKFQHLSEEEKEWIHAQKIMLKFRPIKQYNMVDSEGKPIHKMNKFYLFCEKIVLSSQFETVIIILIGLSIISLLIQYAGNSQKYDTVLEILNLIFTFLFNVELALKLYVIRKAFFYSAWNRFDLIIIILCDILVVISILSYCNVISVYSLSALPIIFRSFRILRIFRLLSVFSHLRALIDTLLYLIPSVTGVGLLIFLLIIVYANIGMGVFSTVPYRSMINPNLHFRNFLSSVLLLFQVISGEDWNRIMNELAYHDCRNPNSEAYQSDYFCTNYTTLCFNSEYVNYTSMKENNMFTCGSDFSFYYFISFVILGPVFILNLCTVIVIEGFSESMYENDGILTQDYMDKFVSVWMKYDPKCTRLVRPHEFVLILKELQPPIGLNYDRYFVNDPLKMRNEREKVVFLRNIINKAEEEAIKSKTKNDNIYLDNYDDFLKFPSFYEFKNFYFSSNKMFYTTDVEVMKIVDKLCINATTPKNLSTKNKRAYSYTLTKKDKEQNNKKNIEPYQESDSSQKMLENKQKEYIHFVDACLAVSRFAVCKSQNISFDKLRPNIVNPYTKKMWTSHYCRDKEVIKPFFDNKKKSGEATLSEILAAKIMYNGVLRNWVERARKRIRERNEKAFKEAQQNNNRNSQILNSNSEIIYNYSEESNSKRN